VHRAGAAAEGEQTHTHAVQGKEQGRRPVQPLAHAHMWASTHTHTSAHPPAPPTQADKHAHMWASAHTNTPLSAHPPAPPTQADKHMRTGNTHARRSPHLLPYPHPHTCLRFCSSIVWNCFQTSSSSAASSFSSFSPPSGCCSVDTFQLAAFTCTSGCESAQHEHRERLWASPSAAPRMLCSQRARRHRGMRLPVPVQKSTPSM